MATVVIVVKKQQHNYKMLIVLISKQLVLTKNMHLNAKPAAWTIRILFESQSNTNIDTNIVEQTKQNYELSLKWSTSNFFLPLFMKILPLSVTRAIILNQRVYQRSAKSVYIWTYISYCFPVSPLIFYEYFDSKNRRCSFRRNF